MKKQKKSAGNRSLQENSVRFQLDDQENQKSQNQQSLNTVQEEKLIKECREVQYEEDSEDEKDFNTSSMAGDGTSTIDFHRLTNKKKQYL